eukprot:4427020-Amphidinium_carterae.1
MSLRSACTRVQRQPQRLRQPVSNWWLPFSHFSVLGALLSFSNSLHKLLASDCLDVGYKYPKSANIGSLRRSRFSTPFCRRSQATVAQLTDRSGTPLYRADSSSVGRVHDCLVMHGERHTCRRGGRTWSDNHMTHLLLVIHCLSLRHTFDFASMHCFFEAHCARMLHLANTSDENINKRKPLHANCRWKLLTRFKRQ